MLAALAAAQAKALAGSDFVGDRFATEARRSMTGEQPERPIHGRATLEEARALHATASRSRRCPLPCGRRAPTIDPPPAAP
jgi:hypothetical protein